MTAQQYNFVAIGDITVDAFIELSQKDARVTVDEKTVFTSDGGLKLEYVPQVSTSMMLLHHVPLLTNIPVSQYIAIIGSGYIGLEFSDVYTVS